MEDKRYKELTDFYRTLLEAERAGVQAISDIITLVEEGEIKTMMTRFLRDEGMNCQILTALIKNLGFEPGDKTGEFIQKIRALNTADQKVELLIKGQEWVAKQIRYNREFIDSASSRFFMEAIKIQHEENVDNMKVLIQMKNIL